MNDEWNRLLVIGWWIRRSEWHELRGEWDAALECIDRALYENKQLMNLIR
jgi:hypothetical protein